MQDEMELLENNATWDLVKLPRDKMLSVANRFFKRKKLLLVSSQGIKQC